MPYRIINELRANGIRPLNKVAETLGMPVTTAHSKLDRVRDKFRGTLLLDFEKLGYPERAIFVMVLKNVKDREKAAEYLSNTNCINSLYITNNKTDFVFDAVFRNAFLCRSFVEGLNKRFRTNINQFKIIKPLKIEKFELET